MNYRFSNNSRRNNIISIPENILIENISSFALKIGPEYSILNEELELLDNANYKRYLEFCAGRACAHTALSKFSLESHPIIIGNKKHPLLPKVFTGSISHTDDFSVCITSKTTHYRSLGIDVESIDRLDESIWKLLANEEDEIPPISDENSAELLLFTCKEAVYKCWHTAGGNRILDYSDISIKFSYSSFTASTPFPTSKGITGKWEKANNHIWALCWLV